MASFSWTDKHVHLIWGQMIIVIREQTGGSGGCCLAIFKGRLEHLKIFMPKACWQLINYSDTPWTLKWSVYYPVTVISDERSYLSWQQQRKEVFSSSQFTNWLWFWGELKKIKSANSWNVVWFFFIRHFHCPGVLRWYWMIRGCSSWSCFAVTDNGQYF